MTRLHNPVIRGFAPDPSMVRAGDWYDRRHPTNRPLRTDQHLPTGRHPQPDRRHPTNRPPRTDQHLPTGRHPQPDRRHPTNRPPRTDRHLPTGPHPHPDRRHPTDRPLPPDRRPPADRRPVPPTPATLWAGPGAACAPHPTRPGAARRRRTVGSGCAAGTGRSRAGRTGCSPSGSPSTARRRRSPSRHGCPEARFWYIHGGARTPVGPALELSRLSDDYGSRLRFTGAMAGIHAVDLVDAALTADFTGFRLTCG